MAKPKKHYAKPMDWDKYRYDLDSSLSIAIAYADIDPDQLQKYVKSITYPATPPLLHISDEQVKFLEDRVECIAENRIQCIAEVTNTLRDIKAATAKEREHIKTLVMDVLAEEDFKIPNWDLR